MTQIVRDARFGLRPLWRNPGFTTVALLALALGIGANTAIFSVVHATLLAPLPFRDFCPRLVLVRPRSCSRWPFHLQSAPAASTSRAPWM